MSTRQPQILTVLSIALLTSLPCAYASMEEAVAAAIHGPERKQVDVHGHKFNVKPTTMAKGENTLVLSGQISHHLTGRPDDQIYYLIVKEGDRVVWTQRSINQGGLASIAGRVIAAGSAYLTGAAIPPQLIESVVREIGQAVDGSWESSCDAIIATIAIKVQLTDYRASGSGPSAPVGSGTGHRAPTGPGTKQRVK